jgi:uncharacterized protein YndB with AHSA1/START domain
MIRTFMLLTVLASLAGCMQPGRDPNQLAAQGQIDDGAPVQTDVDVTIDAKPEKIWALLTGIDAWPTWQPDIRSASLQGPPGQNAAFVWHTGGMDVHSQIRLFVPNSKLAWTGHVLFIHAIHVWTMTLLPDGRTVVRTKESMAGPFIGWFMSSLKLQDIDQRWLAALKRRAEA